MINKIFLDNRKDFSYLDDSMLLSKDRYKRGKNMDRKKIKKQAKMLMKKHFGFDQLVSSRHTK